MIPEAFESIDCPKSAIPLVEALQQTFQDPVSSHVSLEF